MNEDKSVKALLIYGAGGKAFAAGTDIAEFRVLNSDQDCIDYEVKIERILSSLEQCRVPTLAAIAGACTGGGAAIAACCDLRLAAADAKFGFPIARTLGNCLSVANYGRLAHLIGAARVKDLIFTARLIDAEEAKIFGLVGEIVAPDALMARAVDLARTVAGHAPLTLAATKQALLRLRPADGNWRGSGGDVLPQQGFPGGHGGFPRQAPAAMARGMTDKAPSVLRDGAPFRRGISQGSHCLGS